MAGLAKAIPRQRGQVAGRSVLGFEGYLRDVTSREQARLEAEYQALLLDQVVVTSSPAGRTILRLLATERPDPNVVALARSMQASHKAMSLALLKRAQARGELRADLDPKLLLDVLGAAYERLVMQGEFAEITENTVQAIGPIVDLLLRGASNAPSGSRPRRRSRR